MAAANIHHLNRKTLSLEKDVQTLKVQLLEQDSFGKNIAELSFIRKNADL